jgi:hypothetical protein
VSSLLGLAALRVYAFRLELRVHKVSVQIANIESQETLLQQTLSSLIAPGRVVQFSKETLGMESLSQFRVVRVPFSVNKYVNNNNADREKNNNGAFLNITLATKANANE